VLSFVFDQSWVEIVRGLEDGRIDLRRVAPEPDALVVRRNVLKLSPAQAQRLYAAARVLDGIQRDRQQRAEDGRFYAFAVALHRNDMVPPEAPAEPKNRRAGSGAANHEQLAKAHERVLGAARRMLARGTDPDWPDSAPTGSPHCRPTWQTVPPCPRRGRMTDPSARAVRRS
jgi:hypothetical protein